MAESDPRLALRFRSFSRAASLAVAFLGGVVLLGWILGVGVMKSLVPGTVTMKPNTALCFVVIGLALWALVPRYTRPGIRTAARVAAAAVGALALVVLSQYVFVWNLGVDELLFDDPPDAVGTSHGGRMAPGTALALALVAAALLVFDRRGGRYRPSSVLAALVGIIGLAALLSYTSGIAIVYRVSDLNQMAVPTALALIVLALAIAFARPEHGVVHLLASRTTAGHTARRLLPAVIVIPPLLGLLRLEGQRLDLYDTRVGTWLLVLAIVSLAVPLAYLLVRSLQREETGRRDAAAALETRERHYRAKYRAARILTKSTERETALAELLAAVGQELNWPLGAVWLEDEKDGRLHARAVWAASDGAAREFRESCANLSLEPGVGLPGWVWAERKPTWVTDLSADERFVRKKLAARLGLRSTICVPMISGGENYGAIELFSSEQTSLDEYLLETISTLGLELGQFLERTRAGEELQLQGTIMSNMGEGVCLVRVSDWAIVYTNETFERMFGYEHGELLGRPVDTVNAPSERDPVEVADEIQTALARHGSWSGEVKNVKKDGTHFWCLANVSNYDHPEHGTVSVAVHTDITARKQAQEELRESRERLAAILDNSPTVIFLKDLEGRYLVINRQFEQRWGVRQESVHGRTDHELWPAEIADMVRANDLKVIEEGRSIEVEEVILDRTYLSAKFPLRDPGGDIYAVGGVATDITDRKRADDALRRERRQLAEAQAVAKLGSWEWDLTTGVSEWSDEQCRIYGLQPGTPVPDAEAVMLYVHPNDRERVTAKMRGLLVDPQPVDIEFRLQLDNGASPFVSVHANVITDDDGRPVKLAGSTQDVTEQRAFEHELTRARDQALAATHLKSQFLANMSHEIRTPMNGLIGMTELMLDTELSAEQREYAELARSSGETLVALVNDVLDLSKIEAGKLELDSADFRLGEAVEDVSALMSTRAREKGLQLSTLIENDVPAVVRGDELRVRQVLSNLVSNAVKFTNAGEVRVHISRVESRDDAATVRFEVSDTGIGIEPGQLARLFESFEQADPSMTREYGGTGLGLTIARQLTEMMDGQIEAASTPGEGSTFGVTIAFQAGSAEASEMDAFEARSDLQGVHVLVADDNATNRRVLLHLASSWGMRAVAVGDGRAALDELRRAAQEGEPFESVIADMHMPGLTGLELARKVREDPELRATQLVLLSSGLDDRRTARRAGFDSHLSKPVRRSSLYETLVQRKRGPQPREEHVPEAEPDGGGETAGTDEPLVLVAEDNEVNQLLAVRMLERRGYRVGLAANGREAVDAVAGGGDYALVLMDCQMPELDGYEATRAIRAGEAERGEPRTPIVAMTANSMSGDRERCLAAGMDDYLAKPLDAHAFDASLERWAPAADGSGPAPPALNRDAFERLRDDLGSSDLLAGLLDIFRTQTPEHLRALQLAVSRGDAAEVARIAHTLKGGAQTLAAARMASLCSKLEEMGREEALEGAAGLLAAIEGAFGEATDALAAELAEAR